MAIGTLRVDCARLRQPTAGTVEALARLTLAARRRGLALRIVNPTRPLSELIAFCGLAAVLGLEPGRQAEEGEEAGGVEEEGDLGDPSL